MANRKFLSGFFAIVGWFAIIAQLVLMLENRVTSPAETLIRFFSFFTILTNIIVAVYFTLSAFFSARSNHIVSKPGTLTAVTVYISVVGLIYQLILRKIWTPTGLQMIVNELLHSVIPILVIVFWLLYENKSKLRYAQILNWTIYPLVYLAFIMVRGHSSGYYPYPFVDVNALGMTKTLGNSMSILLLFLLLSAILIFIGKRLPDRTSS